MPDYRKTDEAIARLTPEQYRVTQQSGTEAPGTGALDHIAFNATDYDELLASLERNGVKAMKNVTNVNGLRQVFLLDPNGIKLEINIWTK
jgi:hypothetical protein